MDAKEVTRSKVAAPLLSFLILFFLLDATASAVESTRARMSFSCGDAKVQAVTTCTEDSYGAFLAWCTEQRLLFLDRKTGNTVTVKPGIECFVALRPVLRRRTKKYAFPPWGSGRLVIHQKSPRPRWEG